jgi:hypothetical protein
MTELQMATLIRTLLFYLRPHEKLPSTESVVQQMRVLTPENLGWPDLE